MSLVVVRCASEPWFPPALGNLSRAGLGVQTDSKVLPRPPVKHLGSHPLPGRQILCAACLVVPGSHSQMSAGVN